VNDEDQPEVTRRGLFEELAGEAEEKVGELLHNEHLTAAGRDKQAEAESGGSEAPAADSGEEDDAA
jgi:uncharacterized protein YjbJ (UPF0337 family)